MSEIVHTSHNLRLPKGVLSLGPKPLVMGILNVTPDSFSDGGQHNSVENALIQSLNMREQGADIIDIGGESTRPGSDEITAQTELDRIMPVFDALAERQIGLPLSIDTYKAIVADQAVQVGATLINDVHGLQRDPEIADVAALYDLPLIIMHWDNERDRELDLIDEMKRFFEKSLTIADKAGVARDQIVLDPGFGFGKGFAENYELLNRLPELNALGFPLLIGTSRKSMIGKLLDAPADRRLAGTIATTVQSYERGGHIFRIHDVAPNREALQVAHATLYGAPDGIE